MEKITIFPLRIELEFLYTHNVVLVISTGKFKKVIQSSRFCCHIFFIYFFFFKLSTRAHFVLPQILKGAEIKQFPKAD